MLEFLQFEQLVHCRKKWFLPGTKGSVGIGGSVGRVTDPTIGGLVEAGVNDEHGGGTPGF